MAADPQTVWHVLMAPDQMERWLGVRVSSEWKVGSPLVFAFTWDGKAFEGKGTILWFEPEQAFFYTYWSGLSGLPDRPENYSTIAFVTLYEHSDKNWEETLNTIKILVEACRLKSNGFDDAILYA